MSAVAFDLMLLNGTDMRGFPLVKRKLKLATLVKPSPCLRLIDVFNDGEKLLLAAAKYGLEGIVSKKRNSAYQSAKCPSWLKTKTAVWLEANKHRGELFQRKR